MKLIIESHLMEDDSEIEFLNSKIHYFHRNTFGKVLFQIAKQKKQMVLMNDRLDPHILYSKNPILFNHLYKMVWVEQISFLLNFLSMKQQRS